VMISTRPSRLANVKRQKALTMRAEARSYQTGNDEADLSYSEIRLGRLRNRTPAGQQRS
jgi:hypothetical protein